ncbi:MAG: hypothetical protein DRQ51_00485 [Gammaproteobacteria bacterium]|nr:MAG: hypothetical protein DRQ51_00485 [Gammaproteobacteria bacterium]
MKKLLLIVAVFLGSLSFNANAGFLDYMGGGAAIQDVGGAFDDGVAGVFNMGKIFPKTRTKGGFAGVFGGEAEITKSLVKPKYDKGNIKAETDILTLSGYGTYRHYFNKKFYMMLKAGVFYVKSEGEAEVTIPSYTWFGTTVGGGTTTVTTSDTDTGLTYGVQGGMALSRKMDLTANYTAYQLDTTMTLLGVGVKFKF